MKKVVLITGVCGGIGTATARVFRDHDWDIVGTDLKPAVGTDGIGAFIDGDLSLPDTPKQLLNRIKKDFGRLDALVNNAAVQVCKSIGDTSIAEWDLTMNVNVRAAYLTATHAYPLLKESEGAIVNVSSVHALATSVGIAAYAASKGALVALTRALALEFGPAHIRVNALLPGAVQTPMLEAGLCRQDLNESSKQDRLRRLEQAHALGRVGTPEELARSILFLADNDQSSFMTGQSLVVDGGATSRLSTE